MPYGDNLRLGFALSLAGGVLILASGVVGLVWGYAAARPWDMGVMMHGYRGFVGFFLFSAVLSLVAGLVVLLAATALQSKPQQAQVWGTVVIVFSAVSLIGMSGFLVGAILGIIGGALVLSGGPRS